MLQNVLLKNEYRSPRDNIPKDFLIPLLKESILYKRSVGYFSSKSLIEISLGIEDLIANGGKILLMCSPHLLDEDIEAINIGYADKLNEIVSNSIIKEWKEPINSFQEHRLNFLANLILNNKLEIKIALAFKNNKFGLYHEKMGLFYDKDNNIVAFSGSMNETLNALSENYETIDVYKSWNDLESRVLDKERAFENLWNNTDKAACTIEFPEALKNKVVSYGNCNININELKNETKEYLENLIKENKLFSKYEYYELPHISDEIKLRNYQIEAIENWERNNFCGLFDMATGSGKTYTAFAGIVKLINKCYIMRKPILVIIVCPYQHLIEQWYEDVEKFYIDNVIIGYGNNGDKDYEVKLKRSIRDLKDGIKKYQIFMTTNSSFKLGRIQEIIRKPGVDVLFVADEAHYTGAQDFCKYLNYEYKYRLGLSATIDRFRDEEGTEEIHNYYGNICIKYDLEKAINDGNLCHYNYYPIINILTQLERDEYDKITNEIKKHINTDEKGKLVLTEELKRLFIKRSYIIAAADDKLVNFEKTIKNVKDEKHILVYCGTTTEQEYDAVNDKILKQIDQVTRMMGNKLDMGVMRYTSRENIEERKEIKKAFSRGDNVNAIVAIKCLDEGVNIPNIRKAFILASTTNPREYIQRRGRILRNAPGKKIAYLYDFITLPYSLNDVKTMNRSVLCNYKSLVHSEISRMKEYFQLADNKSETYNLINELNEYYNVEGEK